MRRRTVLAAVPAAVGLAGCAGNPGSNDPGATATPDVADRTLPTDAVRFQASRRYVENDDALTVAAPDRAQFVAVDVPAAAGTPAESDAEFALDGERFTPVDDPGGESGVADPDPPATLWYDLPASSGDRAALVADGTRYPVAESQRSKFGRIPDLSLEALDVPDAVTGETFAVTVTAANDGDRAGAFRAGINRDGRVRRLTVSVPPGETATATTRLDVTADAGGTERFGFVHPGAFRNVTVPVE